LPLRSRARYFAALVALATVYIVTARFGLAIDAVAGFATLVWPATGIALAALVIWGYRMWPGVAIGAALANAFTADTHAPTVLGITLGNTLEALAGAYLLRRGGFRASLERVRDVIALVGLAAVVSTTISATIGVSSVWLDDQIRSADELPSAWRVWWLGDMGGDLLVAPFLLVLASGAYRRIDRTRLVEALTLLGLVIALSLLVFSRSSPLIYLVFPPLMWAAFRFCQVGATLSSLIVAAIAVVYVEQDVGPFARGSPDDALLLAQTFTSVAGVTALLLAAITSERQHAEEELRRAHDRLEEKVEERTAEVEQSHKELELQGLIARNMVEGVCLVRAADSAIVYANQEFEQMFGYDSGELGGKQVATLDYRHRSAAASKDSHRIPQELERSGEAAQELLYRKKDGTPFWCHVHTSSFDHPEHGKVWVVVHEDITERKRADVLERSFVPERLPGIPGVELAARFIPGGAGVEVGGDWYDVLELADGRIGLVIGDVAGRGVQAAAVMAQLRNALRAYLFESHPPAVSLTRLNSLAWTLEQRSMATVVYLLFDPAAGHLRLANAGHLPPLLAGPDGSIRFLSDGRSIPIGVRPATSYSEAEYVVESGSTLLLYTDGLVERRGTPIDDGLERLARDVSTGHDGLDDLCDRLLATLAPTGEDDVALLALAPIALEAQRMTLVMHAEPRALAGMRRALRRWLDECEAADEEADEIVLACNEAFANAIEHAYGPGDGTVEIEARLSAGEVTIVVRDFGSWRDARGENRGRGLMLMDALMDSSGVTKRADGTEVRMTRKLKGPDDRAA
jgi:PAS domain S-box-containing protein